MDPGIATQLITVSATLSGVILTLVFNAHQEQRRARDTHNLEAVRQALEHAKWLRDQRVKAYSELSMAGEEVLQFVRTELPSIIGGIEAKIDETKGRWHGLRKDLRKAYNHVALFGGDEAQRAGLDLWRTARHSMDEFFSALAETLAGSSDDFDLNEQARSIASAMGTVGERFLDACRKDLQGKTTNV